MTERRIEEEFRRNPQQYDHSEPLYRMATLVLTLQRHCGVRYDPSKVGVGPDDPFDLHEHFVYGPIQGPGGTCATLPILFAAVGRRLGYPIRLVTSKRHMFCRWDDPEAGVRVNIDGACAEGVNSYPDERYRKHPFPMTRAEERLAGHLDSMTPREELSAFVWRRGSYWHDLGNFRRAVAAYIRAGKVESSRVRWLVGLRTAELDWERRLLALRPAGFPRLEIQLNPGRRRWPGLDWDVEKRLRFLEAAENVLKDPELDEQCWEPLRRGRPAKVALPGKIVVDCTGEDLCTTQP